MTKLEARKQCRLFGALRALDARTGAMDELVAKLKRTCLHNDEGAMAALVALTAELRWQLRAFDRQADMIDATLDLDRKQAAEDKRSSSFGRGKHRRRRVPRTELRGTTDVLPVPELIGMLSNLGKTGTLELRTPRSAYLFELQSGRVVHAVTNELPPDLRLGTILVANNKLTEDELQQSLDASCARKELLGTHLVRTATVTEADLREALDLQVRFIFEQAFSLRAAQWRFRECALSQIAQRTAVNTTAMLLEAARQHDIAARAAGSARGPAPAPVAGAPRP